MPHTHLLLNVLESIVKAVLIPLPLPPLPPLPPVPVKEPLKDVIAGLPYALDQLIISTIFKSGDLTKLQIETLTSLFKNLDTYLTTLTNLLQKIKLLLPVAGRTDNNKVARLLLVKELKKNMLDWAKTKQDGLQQASCIITEEEGCTVSSTNPGTNSGPPPTPY